MSRIVMVILAGCGQTVVSTEGGLPLDRDGDSYVDVAFGGTDCDDADASVNPGVPDGDCDGRDSDCDGEIDEEAEPWFLDEDGDGFGGIDKELPRCERPAGAVSQPDDCDDGTAAVHPGALEVCDGTDNDCDGGVDDVAAATVRGENVSTVEGAVAIAVAQDVPVYVCPGDHTLRTVVLQDGEWLRLFSTDPDERVTLRPLAGSTFELRDQARLTLVGATVKGAVDDWAVTLSDQAQLWLEDAAVRDNRAGGIWVQGEQGESGALARVDGFACELSGNVHTTVAGAAIRAEGDYAIALEQCELASNSTYGGALWLDGNAPGEPATTSLTLIDSSVSNNISLVGAVNRPVDTSPVISSEGTDWFDNDYADIRGMGYFGADASFWCGWRDATYRCE